MSRSFIAVLDHQHLENSVFLTSFARSIAKLGNRKGIIVHGDSPYTDRLIQTGMMREDARLRAIKDLSKRLIGLFADQGVPAIGLHAFQKGLVQKNGAQLTFDRDAYHQLHEVPNLLLSCLVQENDTAKFLPLPEFVKMLAGEFDEAEILLFSKNEKDEILRSDSKNHLSWSTLPPSFREKTLPEEFQNFRKVVKITTATDMGNWPKLKNMTEIV
jgi:hypothetical protein